MSLFHMDFESMDSTAQVLQTGAETMTTTAGDLKTAVDALVEGDFKTDLASTAFADGYQNFTDGIVKALEGFDGMADNLRDIASKSQEFDSKLLEED